MLIIKTSVKNIENSKKYYSGLYCLCCHFVMDEDCRGNFYCKKCRAKIGVLR